MLDEVFLRRMRFCVLDEVFSASQKSDVFCDPVAQTVSEG